MRGRPGRRPSLNTEQDFIKGRSPSGPFVLPVTQTLKLNQKGHAMPEDGEDCDDSGEERFVMPTDLFLANLRQKRGNGICLQYG